jgi:hypothetical protein
MPISVAEKKAARTIKNTTMANSVERWRATKYPLSFACEKIRYHMEPKKAR